MSAAFSTQQSFQDGRCRADCAELDAGEPKGSSSPLKAVGEPEGFPHGQSSRQAGIEAVTRA